MKEGRVVGSVWASKGLTELVEQWQDDDAATADDLHLLVAAAATAADQRLVSAGDLVARSGVGHHQRRDDHDAEDDQYASIEWHVCSFALLSAIG